MSWKDRHMQLNELPARQRGNTGNKKHRGGTGGGEMLFSLEEFSLLNAM